MHPIVISQLGEGLTEVRVVALLKKEGDAVEKDQPVLEVETDKAMMEIETPQGGVLSKWLVQEGEVVAVGATVALIDAPQTTKLEAPLPQTVASTPILRAPDTRNGAVSPRERASRNDESNSARLEISARQKRLGELFLESQNYVAEASLTMRVPWDGLVSACRQLKGLEGLDYRPTPPELLAWCVVQAMRDHPRLMCLNRGAGGYEKQAEVCLGNAVTLPGDELAVASIPNASRLELPAFIRALRHGVTEVREGRATPGRCQLLISYMAQHNVWTATPRVLFPAVATLFVGTPYEVPAKAADGSLGWQRLSNFVLTFDHRLLNGVGAAAFLQSVVRHLASHSPAESNRVGDER